jgi:hypothetical protein
MHYVHISAHRYALGRLVWYEPISKFQRARRGAPTGKSCRTTKKETKIERPNNDLSPPLWS